MDFEALISHLQASEELPGWSMELQGRRAGLGIRRTEPGQGPPFSGLKFYHLKNDRVGSAGL